MDKDKKYGNREMVIYYCGKIGRVNLGGLRVEVVIKDIKERWGRLRFLVSPVRGTGEVWVEQVSLK